MLAVGDRVRLVRPASGTAAGSEGTLLGWYSREVREALVDFSGSRRDLAAVGDRGPLKVPADAIEKVV
jgi:hypothetical protein